MSSNLKVNTILPSTGTTIGIGTVGGLINVVGNIDVNSTSGISTFNGLEISGIVTAKAGAAVTYYGDGSNLTGLNSDVVSDTSPQLGGNLDTNSKNIVFGDSSGTTVNRLTFGGQADMKLFHDGTNSVVSNATGDLYVNNNADIIIKPANDLFLKPQDGEDGIKVIGNGAVELYHNNVKRFETDVNGARVVAPEGERAELRIIGDEGDDNNDYFKLSAGEGTLKLQDASNGSSWEDNIVINAAGSVEMYHNNTKKIETAASGVVIPSGANNCLRIFGSNAVHATSALIIGQNNTTTSQLRAYGPDSSTNGRIEFRSSRSDASNTVNLIYDSGNLQFASGHGIDFSATSGSPSNGGEILDDYEEGDFTASLGGLSNWSSYSVTGTGHYVKIGKAVHININWGNVDLNNSASGRVIIFNLPFTPYVRPSDCRGVTSNYMAHKVQHANDGMIHSWYISSTYGFMGQITKNNTGWTSWDASNFTATGVYLDFSATYFTAS